MRFLLILLLCIGVAYGQVPPKILSNKDAKTYRQIFAVQAHGDWKSADAFIKKLKDETLMGYVLFQRYMHPTKYRAKYIELSGWLKKYADHPGSTRVYRLAKKRRPANYKAPVPPKEPVIPSFLGRPALDGKIPSQYKGAEWNILISVRTRVHEGRVTVGKKYIAANAKKLRPFVHAEALGHIARGYFRYKKYGDSIAMAEKSQRAKKGVASAEASWWGGLSAWRLKKYSKAAELFSYVGKHEENVWLKSAGAFWAGRAYTSMGQKQKAEEQWLIALSSPHSFYGLLASAKLGIDQPINWQPLPKSKVSNSALLKIPAVRRAAALAEAGEIGRAESTMKPLIKRLHEDTAVALLNLAKGLDLPYTLHATGEYLERTNNDAIYSALYPTPNWLMETLDNTPHAEMPIIDKAVVLGFALQESKFLQRAKSSAGARGIMQLMPATASFIRGKRIPRNRRDILFEPTMNITLGRKYIAHLLRNDRIDNNLLMAVIAYNSGSGNLNKWRRKISVGNDPLLFIESLPWRESRIYVERVVANIWVYRLRLGQDVPSLKAVANGQWPSYISQE